MTTLGVRPGTWADERKGACWGMWSRGRPGLVMAGVAVLVGAAAACAPVAPPPPPSPPPAPTGCDAASQPTPTVQAPVSYAVVVAPYGSPTHEVTSFTATSEAAKNADVASLGRSGTVLAVEPNQVVRATSDPPVNTGGYPSFSLQWGLQGPPGGDFAPAWNISGYSGRGITVAVVDSGVDLDHSGLVGHVIAGPDFFTDASGSTPVSPSLPGHGDPFGHGTHVAGIIADNDPSGGLGGAPNATILAVRVLGPDGSGSTLSVAQGIEWAASHGAEVINLSLGAAGCDSVIQTAVTDAHHEGVVIAAAAGNDANSELFSPAGYSNEVIGVAAIDPGTGALASFSNRGAYVSLGAPGVDVLSTCAYTGCIAPSTPSDTAYGYLDGTSMAAPFVSAAAALVREECPSFTPAQVQSELVNHAGPAVPGFAFHRLDAGQAVAAACH